MREGSSVVGLENVAHIKPQSQPLLPHERGDTKKLYIGVIPHTLIMVVMLY